MYEYNVYSIYQCKNSSQHMPLTNHLLGNCAGTGCWNYLTVLYQYYQCVPPALTDWLSLTARKTNCFDGRFNGDRSSLSWLSVKENNANYLANEMEVALMISCQQQRSFKEDA